MPRRRPSPSPLAAALSRRRFLGRTLAVAATVPALPAPRLARARGGGVVSVYNWDTYIGETTLEDFTATSATTCSRAATSCSPSSGGATPATT